MAVQFQAIEYGIGGVVNKPSSSLVSDLLFVYAISDFNSSNDPSPTIVAPSNTNPWTLLQTNVLLLSSGSGNSTYRRISVFWKVASSSEPSSFTFSLSGTVFFGGITQTYCLRMSGHLITNPIGASNGSTYDVSNSSIITPGVTPVIANSALMFFALSTGNSSNMSNYAVSTSNPTTWNEILDTGGDPDYAIAYAIRPEMTATGNFTAVTSANTAGKQGITLAISPSLLGVVNTQPVSSIQTNQAIANGNVFYDNGYAITERGIVWATTTNPTTSNFKGSTTGTTGAYTISMSGLSSGTAYYVRSYVINANGTAYGEQVSFVTLSAPANTVYKDISGVEGQEYAVQLNIGGSSGSVTVSLGSTGDSQTFLAGAGTVSFQGAYGGINGLTIVSNSFNGYIDNVNYVLVLGDASIDWSLTTLTNIYPVNSSVLFRRFEDTDFDQFRIYRYLDIQFKDLDAYVTVVLKKEANQGLTESSKEFIVSNFSGEVLPFINKRISMLVKSQAVRIELSNNKLNETFTVCQFIIKGMGQPSKLFDKSKIISIN